MPDKLAHKNINLTIVGKTKPVYRPLASDKPTLFEQSMNFFRKLKLMDRINYHQRLDIAAYSKLLSNSHIHFYFSRPFIASWSLLEAMSSGCCLVSNETPMTSEFLIHNSHSLMVNCIDNEQSAEELISYFSDQKLIRDIAKQDWLLSNTTTARN